MTQNFNILVTSLVFEIILIGSDSISTKQNEMLKSAEIKILMSPFYV
jgi:hypothetical protein